MYKVELTIGVNRTTVQGFNNQNEAIRFAKKEAKIFDFNKITIEKYENELERCF